MSHSGLVWDTQAVARGLTAVACCREQLISTLKVLLDDYQGWNKSLRYYEIIAGDWLEHFAHLTYAALAENKNAVAIRSPSVIPVSADLNAHALLRFKHNKLEDHLRWAVDSLLYGVKPDYWEFESHFVKIVTGASNRNFAHRVLNFSGTTRPDVLLTSPNFKSSKLETLRVLCGWRKWLGWDDLRYPIRISAVLDQSWRKRQALTAWPASDLLGLMHILLPLHLPVALLEGLRAYRGAALAMPVSRPKVVYSANALQNHLSFKLLVAEWADEGTKLLYHQHGGGYGIDRVHAIEEYETRVADRYFTWGWTAKNPKVQPLSPPALHTPSKTRRHILLSCVNYPQPVYRLHFHPMPGTIQTMHRQTCDFLAKLRDHKNLLIRPYSSDYGWGFEEMMRGTAPSAAFDDRRTSPFVRYAQSRLVVHNYLGTGYLETLALDIPTVCFFDSNTYAFRAAAQPWIDALERVGVLHRSGGAAAKFVVGLENDSDGWWRKSEVQQARLDFTQRYANFSSDWARRWENEFQQWLN